MNSTLLPNMLLRPPRGPSEGAEREALTSYTRRVCEFNQLHLSDAWNFGKESVSGYGKLLPGCRSLNSLSKLANAGRSSSAPFLELLSLFTGEDNFGTMMLSDLTDLHGLGRIATSPTKKWCASCYCNDLSTDVGPYDRLLWSIDAVWACPLHNETLQSICVSCKTACLPLLSGCDHSGCCSRCNEWLGQRKGRPLKYDDHRDSYELWKSKLFSDLLETRFDCDIDLRANVIGSMNLLCAHHFGGVDAAFSRAISRNKSVLSTWKNGRSLLPWAAVIDISFVFQIPVLELFASSADAVSFSMVGTLPSSVARHTSARKERGRCTLDQVNSLISKLRDGELAGVRNMTDAAIVLGIDKRTVRERFAEQNRELGTIFRLRRAARIEAKIEARTAQLTRSVPVAVASILANPGNVTRRAIGKCLMNMGITYSWSEERLVRGLVKDALSQLD